MNKNKMRKSGVWLVLVQLLFIADLQISLAQDNTFLLSAPPREPETSGTRVYGPIAEFLSRVTGLDIVYEHPDNSLVYWENVQKNRYDVVFDESHFIAYLISNHQHLPLVRVSGALIYVYYVNDNPEAPSRLEELAGLSVCGQSPPNQGTLALFELFDNPFRLPHLVPVEGWARIHREVSDDGCVAGVAPLELYDKLNEGDKHPIYMTRPLPNQTFAASGRLSPEIKSRMTAALLSEEGREATSMLRQLYNIEEFERAFEVEYIGHDRVLTEQYPFQLFGGE